MKGQASKGKIVAETADGRTVKITYAQWLLATHLKELGVATDYEFHLKERAWRFDLVLPEQRILVEIHGGQFSGGHRRGFWSKKVKAQRAAKGLLETPQEDEYLKLCTAAMEGYRVLQFSNEQVNDCRAKQFIKGHLRPAP
jgi:very-short-patch-repair endonuclease